MSPGFSYHYSFHCRLVVCGLDYPFSICFQEAGHRLVSTPSSIRGLARDCHAIAEVSPNLAASHRWFPNLWLKLSPRCLPFHHSAMVRFQYSTILDCHRHLILDLPLLHELNRLIWQLREFGLTEEERFELSTLFSVPVFQTGSSAI